MRVYSILPLPNQNHVLCAKAAAEGRTKTHEIDNFEFRNADFYRTSLRADGACLTDVCLYRIDTHIIVRTGRLSSVASYDICED